MYSDIVNILEITDRAEELTELEDMAERLKAEQMPVHIDLGPDYVDPEWGVMEKAVSEELEDATTDELIIPVRLVQGNRPYLDKISQLLDLMAPVCRQNPLLRADVINMARSMMESGFEAELNGEMERGF